eukprot:6508627-Alexandrium_andersonii.AAC.1
MKPCNQVANAIRCASSHVSHYQFHPNEEVPGPFCGRSGVIQLSPQLAVVAITTARLSKALNS